MVTRAFRDNDRAWPHAQLLAAGVFTFFTGTAGDKDWPLTDCVSFVVMEDGAFKTRLTGDKHFEQAGFRAVVLK